MYRRNNLAIRSLAALILGSILALSLLSYRYFGRHTDFGDAAALGAQTQSVFVSKGSHLIHCQPDAHFEDCLRGIEIRKSVEQAIWLGNSQLHAINQYVEGDLTAPAILADLVEQKSIDLVAFSHANANLLEHYIIFEFIRSRVNFKHLILPVVFDDFRENGVRRAVADFLDDQLLTSLLAESDFGAKMLSKYGLGESLPVVHTPMDLVETALDSRLGLMFGIWRARPEIRGDLLITLYRLRNRVFGITSDTKRRMLPEPYAWNMAALEALLESAKESGISVVTYIAPIGSKNGERPYKENEYERFKTEVSALTKKFGVTFSNFEDLIPDSLWGRTDSISFSGSSEFDFMHFTSKGHGVLANQIMPLLLRNEGVSVGKQ
jgi:hypothetical protein